MVMLVFTNPWLMLQVLAVLMLVVLPAVWLGRRVRRLSRASQDRVADASALAGEVLNAILVVQSYTAERREADRFDQRAWQAMSTALRRVRARAVLVGFVITASSAVLLWGLYMGALAVREGTLSPGVLGQTVFYVILLASALAVLGETYGDMLRAAGATERLMELLHAESMVTEPSQPQSPPWPTQGSALVLESLRFHYPSRPGVWAVDGLSGQVQAGRTVAVVGPSGAGKTTLFDLLMRFHDPQQGLISIDGTPGFGVSPKDLILATIAQIGAGGADRAAHLGAPGVDTDHQIRVRRPKHKTRPVQERRVVDDLATGDRVGPGHPAGAGGERPAHGDDAAAHEPAPRAHRGHGREPGERQNLSLRHA